jgi:hypothetical protein
VVVGFRVCDRDRPQRARDDANRHKSTPATEDDDEDDDAERRDAMRSDRRAREDDANDANDAREARVASTRARVDARAPSKVKTDEAKINRRGADD